MSSIPLRTRCEQLVSFFNRARLSKAFGMQISYDDNGAASFVMPYNPSFDHGMGGIYGGVIASMIDNAGWFTVAAQTDYWVSTVSLNIQLLEPAERVQIRSVGELVRTGKRLAVAKMEVLTETDSLIAIGSGTFSISSIKRSSIQ